MIVMLLDLEAMKPRRGLRAKLNVFEDAIPAKSEVKKTLTTDEVFAKAFAALGL
jgi:hypothetical protein